MVTVVWSGQQHCHCVESHGDIFGPRSAAAANDDDKVNNEKLNSERISDIDIYVDNNDPCRESRIFIWWCKWWRQRR